MTIQISNLVASLSNQDVLHLFSSYGTVSDARIVTDSFTEQPRGFAFVEMPDDTEAQKAISGLNNTELDGRVISVQAAPPQVKKGSYPVGGSFRKYGGYKRTDKYKN